MPTSFIAYFTFASIGLLKQPKITRSLGYLSSRIFCNVFLNLIMKSETFSIFCNWIYVNFVIKIWYAIGWEYWARKVSSISVKHVIGLVGKDKYQSYACPTKVWRKNITTLSCVTGWLSQMAKNCPKSFSRFITPSPMKRGRTPPGREGKGCLSPRRSNNDALHLCLGFCTTSLLSSSGSIVSVSKKSEIL